MILAALAVFSGLSLNLFLQFALGASGIASDTSPEPRPLPLFQLGVLFAAVLFLWVVFTYLTPSGSLGFLEYFLFFPVSALVCMRLELLAHRVFPKTGIKKCFSAYTAYDGLVPAALIITFTLAANFPGAFILALFFALCNIFSMLILNEIHRRSKLEWVPRFLRGSPIILISMGLLSLIFASAAVVCFKILDVF
jgi:electron transport complex protein RnfA